MDGVDVAMIKTNGIDVVESLGHVSLAYPVDLQQRLKALARVAADCAGDVSVCREICGDWDRAIVDMTAYHIDAISQLVAGYSGSIDVIGFHGQTLYHNPGLNITLQVGDGAALMRVLNVPVVQQFRLHDVAAGGQGAPLAPVYHQALVLRDDLAPAVVINCGGITNATVVEGAGWGQVWASDLGPGSGLIDRLVAESSQGRLHYDRDGVMALQGRVDQELLARLWQQGIRDGARAFVDRAWPKSLDIHDAVLPSGIAHDGQGLYNACATLLQFSAETVLFNLLHRLQAHAYRIVVCGGGWQNPVLLEAFQSLLAEYRPQDRLLLASQCGWQAQAVEAELFAFLAVRAQLGLPGSGPQTTGVATPCVGGELLGIIPG